MGSEAVSGSFLIQFSPYEMEENLLIITLISKKRESLYPLPDLRGKVID